MQPLAMLFSAAVFGALWLPWFHLPQPFGGPPATLAPWELLEPIFNPPQGRPPTSLTSYPAMLLAFLSAFLVAAFTAVMSMLNVAPRSLILVAGAVPFAVIAWAVGSAMIELDRSGLPMRDLFDGARMLGIDAQSFGRFLTGLGEVLGLGSYLHYAGSLALVILGLAMPRKTDIT